MKFIIASVVVAAVLTANGGCGDEEPRKYARRRDASQPSSDASDAHIVDSGLKPPNDGGASSGTGGGEANAGRSGAGIAADGGASNDGGPCNAGTIDAQVPPHASCDLDDAGEPPQTGQSSSFTVPCEGGSFEFCSTTGLVRLDFPPALGGLRMTLTALDPNSFAWPHPGFAAAMSDAIRIETNRSITQPIRIRLPNGALLAFVFHVDSTVPLPLRLSEDRLSLELTHSGVLGVLAPDRTCESTLGMPFTNGWQEEQNPGICSAFGARSKWRHYECANTPFCQDILSWCCVYPGDTHAGCTIDDGIHYNDFLRAGPNAEYSYCDGLSDTPYVHAVSPSVLVSNDMDQTVTLTGNNLLEGGYVFASDEKGGWSSGYIEQSTWISSTTVTAVVSGQVLTQSPEIWYAYRNPGYRDLGRWVEAYRYTSNGIVGTVAASAIACPVPLEGSPSVGSCGSLPNGCQCSVDFDPGGGVHTYAMNCTDVSCACTRDGVTVTTKPRINACNNNLTTQDQWRRSCLATPGFCP